MMKSLLSTIVLASCWIAPVCADESKVSDEPKVIPATRPEIKAALDALKSRQARLPMPPADAAGGVNNGRMRAKYLPETWHSANRSARGGRQPGTANSRSSAAQDPDYGFKTSCFWIVSRGNNCHYCLGHQELKLRSAGLNDDQVAALDTDWSQFDPRWQAALAYARELTLESHNIAAYDFTALKKEMTDPQIIELTYDIARFNATNRWTDGMGLPQDGNFREESSNFLTPTSDRYQKTASIVSPITRSPRPARPSFAEIVAKVTAAQHRTARVVITTEPTVEQALAAIIGSRAPRAWEATLASLGETGMGQIKSWNTILSDDNLTPRLKAEMWLIAAAENHAWYSVGQAMAQLKSLGVSLDEQSQLLAGSGESADKQGAVHQLARKLTTDPHTISDRDIYAVRELHGDPGTAQIVHVICIANLMTRFTEALQLPLEAETSPVIAATPTR